MEREDTADWETIRYKRERNVMTGGEVVDAETVAEPLAKRKRAVFAEVEKQRERDA